MNHTGLKTIAYLGPKGTYSEQAVSEWCSNCETLPVGSIPAVAESVVSGKADQGIVPIENSIEGGVTFTLDLLIHEPNIFISGEVIVPINHCLMAKTEMVFSEINTVYSHPQSLGQCRTFLEENMPQANLIASMSNSAAVEEMIDSDGNSAAISSRRAAMLYNAEIIKCNVEDQPNNETRFVVLDHKDHERTGKDKTSICFEFGSDSPGILSNALSEFSERGINLMKIESRPNKKSLGKYIFLVDLQGHRTDKLLKEAIIGLKQQTEMIKILGSYPTKK